jgi:hypothetical protein
MKQKLSFLFYKNKIPKFLKKFSTGDIENFFNSINGRTGA